MPFDIISRDEWGALPPKKEDPPLEHPIKWVSMSYVTTEEDVAGAEAVKLLQERDFKKGQSDIQSNFLISGDGLVFEGRGWHTQPGNANDYPGKEGKFLEITYIGDYQNADMDHPVFNSTGSLLEIGVGKKYVAMKASFIGNEEANPERFLPPSTQNKN